MKKTTKKTTKKTIKKTAEAASPPSPPSTAKLSFYPGVNADAAKKAFLLSVKKPTDGSNCYLEKFLTVMDHLTNNMRSFTVRDVLYCAQPFEIPAEETKRLFGLWSDMMVSLNKLDMVQGAYDDPVWIYN